MTDVPQIERHEQMLTDLKESTADLNMRTIRIEDALANMNRQLEKIDNAVSGNGREGLNTRVERMELRQRLIYWLLGSFGAGMVALLVKLVGDLLHVPPAQ